MATPHGEGPVRPDPLGDSIRDRMKRRDAARHRLAKESWPEFFKGYLIEIAVIAALVGVVALIFWLLR